MLWTEEMIARVVELAEAGHTMREIGREFGVTKNAVIGVYRRERMKRGTLPPPTPKKRVLKSLNPVNILPPMRRDPTPYKDTVDKAGGGRLMPLPTLPATGIGVIMPVLTIEAPRTPAVGILDVTGCRWPIGEDDGVPGGHTFCNCARREGSSYCAEHSKARVAEGSRETIRQTIRSSLHLVRKARAA